MILDKMRYRCRAAALPTIALCLWSCAMEPAPLHGSWREPLPPAEVAAPQASPETAFLRGREMYDVNKFQEAALLFESVAVEAEAPVERRIAAARLHLDCLNRLRRYEEMGQAARRYLDAGFASEDLQRTFERILVLSALHVCHDLEANKAYLEAGDCLLALAREHFDAHGGDVVGMPAAFDNAAAMYDMGGDVRQALQVRLARLRLFAGGPNSDELMLDIALGYERLGDLEKARKFYEIVAQTYPNAAAGKRASDALRRLQP